MPIVKLAHLKFYIVFNKVLALGVDGLDGEDVWKVDKAG